MTQPNTAATNELTSFGGSVPHSYDTDLGPLLFEFSAADLARRAVEGLHAGSRVLEVACGTGICTEHLWRALPLGAEITATDINPAMLALAREKRGKLLGVSFEEADALCLPYEDNSFDLAVCQFGIMFFPDKKRGLEEIVRVLKPGGRVVFNVWDSFDHNQVVKLAHSTISTFFDTDPPRFLELPFGYHDIDAIKDLVQSCDLEELSVDVIQAAVEHSAESAARGLVEGNPGINEIRARGLADAETITKAVTEILVETYGTPRPAFPLQEIVFTARKNRQQARGDAMR